MRCRLGFKIDKFRGLKCKNLVLNVENLVLNVKIFGNTNMGSEANGVSQK